MFYKGKEGQQENLTLSSVFRSRGSFPKNHSWVLRRKGRLRHPQHQGCQRDRYASNVPETNRVPADMKTSRAKQNPAPSKYPQLDFKLKTIRF